MPKLLSALFVLTLLTHGAQAQSGPLRIYILAGQSNMQGHAKIETLDYLADDPETKPLLKLLRQSNGKPRVARRTRISYLTSDGPGNGEGIGKLSAGFGARRRAAEDGGKFGPEFSFGLCMEKATRDPILIIKAAWGGKSLHTDFRPPSAGPYVFSPEQIARLKKQGKNIEEMKAEKAAATGRYYRFMMDHVKSVLKDLKRVHPGYQKRRGFEIAGFVWFQGFNDLVDRDTYPRREEPGGYDAYSRNLAALIRDVRRELETPELPFLIGVIGVEGPLEGMGRYRKVHSHFRAAMAAPAKLDEFKGTVMAVETAPYWDRPLAAIRKKLDQVRDYERRLRRGHRDTPNKNGDLSAAEQKAEVQRFRSKLISKEEETQYARGASNAGYHYLGCGKTMALIGQAFAEALLRDPPSTRDG
jgi:carbohydrate esterase-like sialic acid-specific acetylesterase